MNHEPKKEVKKYLEAHKTITPLQALDECRCYRLSGVIYRLRKEGMNIITEEPESGRYAVYRYIPESA